jgi:group II intron reverse transcriptase/maturase
MQNAETLLAIYGERGRHGKLLEGIYRQLFNPELYLRAYHRLAQNEGAMTRGATEETVDAMSKERIQGIIELLRHERYRWTPVRRVLIPKGDGKLRPLGIPSWSDKLLQEVMRSLLSAYYEPQFNGNSHGFRPGRGCHTALRDVYRYWTGTKWFIEGDIKGCFDNIDHSILMSILREKIRDGRFLTLVEDLLEAGYLEEWKYRPTPSGTPQGGIASPLLANIYMDRLDRYVEEAIIPKYTRGARRRKTREYQRVRSRIYYIKKGSWGSPDELPALHKQMRNTDVSDHFDPDYRRLTYIRYADDFLLGFAGPKDEAEEIKAHLRTFLHDQLKLELSPEKTLITHAATEEARFLGYGIRADGHFRARRHGSGRISLRIPIKKLKEKLTRYMTDGKPIHRAELLNESDFAIIEKYGSEYRGIVQYYAHACNRRWLGKLHWIMRGSLLKTLAAKHKSTVKKMARRFAGKAISKHGVMKCLSITIARQGRRPLYAQFGGISLRREPFAEILDQPCDQDRRIPRRELLERLRADKCELCGSRHKVQVHHIRKLSDLKVKGQKERPTWLKVMSAMKRKTLIVCERCHVAIHAGQPTRTHEDQEEPIEG